MPVGRKASCLQLRANFMLSFLWTGALVWNDERYRDTVVWGREERVDGELR